ncbi:MAG TPA: ASPIC/UnbV domain-containing protein, partial [Chthoniobacteraceae bacterium]|nr:ASPIC/UnbV domain-containing protein [Chthoniobacteraceae bacterium]
VQQSQTYAQPAQLFWNRGGRQRAGFEPVPPEKAGPDLFRPIVGRGAACGDLDGDGDADVVLTQSGGRPLVLRNDQQLGHHFARLKLVGAKGNREAIGALVRARVGAGTRTQQIMPSRGYLSASELPITFGLDAAGAIHSLEVVWPDGKAQKVEGWKRDAVSVVEETR